jgi:hypothetical protein
LFTVRKFIGIVSSGIAAGICIWVAVRFFPERTIHGLISHVLIAVVLTGLIGLVGAILCLLKSPEKWVYLVWSSTGGLFALTCIGILSIAPYMFDALIFALLASVLFTHWSWRSAINNLGLAGITALTVFVLMLQFVVSAGVDMVDVPEGTTVMASLPQIDYVDAFQIDVPGHLQVNIDTLIVLTRLSLIPTYGDTPAPDKLREQVFESGFRIGHWSVYYKDSCEAHIGFQRSYIDFKVSIFQQRKADRSLITLATVAQFKNIWGALYFIPVRYGHQIYLADTARRLRAHLLSTI